MNTETVNNMETEETMDLHVLISQNAAYRKLARMARKDLDGYSRAIDKCEDRISERLKQPRHELRGLYAIVIADTHGVNEGDCLAIKDNDEHAIIATVANKDGTVICGVIFDTQLACYIDIVPKERFDEAYAKCLAMQQELINSEQL